VARASNEGAANKSAEAFKALVEYALTTLKKDANKNPPEGRERFIYEFKIEILNKSSVTRIGNEARWHIETNKASLSDLLPAFVPEDLVK
jgi:hypothetical protein